MRTFPAAGLALTLGILLIAEAAAAPSIVGSWSGRGTVRLTSGQVEPVSCRVSYEKGDSAGRTFVFNAKCAAPPGTFLLYGRISKRSASTYRGSIFNDQSRVSGKVSISLRGNSQTIRATSSQGVGNIRLRRR